MNAVADKVILSIIVPIYGVEKYLRQCLESIVAQTFKDFECILVDDGSKDGSPAICDEYADRDNRFKVVHKKNAGYGAAVNTGLDIANGDWIGIVEPDDWIESEMYKVLVSRAIETDADIVKTGFDTFYDDGRRAWALCFDALEMASAFKLNDAPKLLNNHPSIWSCVYRRGFLMDHGIRMEESPGATWQDNLFQVQSMVLAESISFAPGKMYHYRLFDDKQLKDITLPLRRSLQIRQWVNEVGYSGEAACGALLIRELNYIKMAVAAAKFRNLRLISKLSSDLLHLSSFGKSSNCRNRSKRAQLMIWCTKICPLLCVLWIKLDFMHKIGNVFRALRLRR